MHLPHLARAGKVAASDNHELGTTFRIKPSSHSFAAFRRLAGDMADAAETHKDALTKRGMSPEVLDDLKRALAEFDAASELCSAGRAAHVGARVELKVVADEIVKRVRLLDAVNRLRFRNDPSLLAAWQNVSKVRATPKTGDQDAEGGAEQPEAVPPAGSSDVRPAA